MKRPRKPSQWGEKGNRQGKTFFHLGLALNTQLTLYCRMTTDNNNKPFDKWKEENAESLDPLLERLDFDDEFAVRRLLLDAYYAGVADGIDQLHNAIQKESNEA